VHEILDELVALSRRIGLPANDYVLLAEGNTSALLDDGTFLVKASGARLDGIAPAGFVRLRLEPLLEAVLSDASEGAEELFRTARVETSPGAGRPSIETFVHVASLGLAGARWVVHTHPTALTGLLCSAHAEELLLAGPLFPDEAVVCGTAPLYVPYAEPGLQVARAFAPRVEEHTARVGEPPRVVLLGNHGLVALGATAAEAEAVTAMAVKAARVRLVAAAAGGLRPLAAASVAELVGRSDEVERRAEFLRGRT
jgi:rhamnose utilization protein RhaD (predicted bifunctional aldolase and dehydrogenase)